MNQVLLLESYLPAQGENVAHYKDAKEEEMLHMFA